MYMRMTCPKDEYLEIDTQVLKLSNDILNDSEIEKANRISEYLASTKKIREFAREELRVMVGTKPKRPMFYLFDELGYLPNSTRESMRDLGDYIDHLIKFCSSEKLKDKSYEKRSLSSNLRSIKGLIPEKLRLNLIRYDNLLYVPAKHDFDVKIRRHRFTSKEVVFACFITMKLAEEIKILSNRAKNYSEGRIYG